MRVAATIIIMVAMLSGCTFTLVGNAPKTEAAIVHDKTINASFTRSEAIENLCPNDGEEIAAVRFHTNVVYLATSLLSFGLYVPQHVTWWCGTEEEECEDGDTSGDCEPYRPQ